MGPNDAFKVNFIRFILKNMPAKIGPKRSVFFCNYTMSRLQRVRLLRATGYNEQNFSWTGEFPIDINVEKVWLQRVLLIFMN